jgi:hypothetical protein
MLHENVPNIPHKFYCEKCDYGCSKTSIYKQHLNTSKHQNATYMLQNATKNICECGKQFQHHSSYYRHKKKCNFNNIFHKTMKDENIIIDSSANEVSVLTNLVLELVKSNGELQKQMLEVCKNGIHNTINNNSHNKTFNLQFFLNETCKDAMNIMDFVDSIKIQLADIESIGQLGFVNGMSKLIIKHLKALDENMRPVHCSDPKRESLYVKDENVWEKEDPENKKIKKAIKYISHKNICAIPEWKAKYPDCIYSDSKKSDQYNHIVIEAMGGSGDNDLEKAEKIVKKIAKEVIIDKSN